MSDKSALTEVFQDYVALFIMAQNILPTSALRAELSTLMIPYIQILGSTVPSLDNHELSNSCIDFHTDATVTTLRLLTKIQQLNTNERQALANAFEDLYSIAPVSAEYANAIERVKTAITP